MKNKKRFGILAIVFVVFVFGMFCFETKSKIEILNQDNGNVKFLIKNALVELRGASVDDIKKVELIKPGKISQNVKTLSGNVVKSSREFFTFTTDIFAMEPIPMESATITLEKKDSVNAILKCEDFNFKRKTCSDWQLTKIPFQDNKTHITFTVDSFSGYAGTNLEIIDVHSSPMVGGNWTVRFDTTGTADLTITATREIDYTENYTRWTNYSEDSGLYDLKFLELKCGEKVLEYEWQGGDCSENECSIFIPDYSCNETGYENSLVLSNGRHVLKFEYAEQTAYAYNSIYTCTTCADCNTKIGSASSGDTVRLTADIINYSGADDSTPAGETCISFGGKDNIIFDCDGYTINGEGDSFGYGIWLEGISNGNTIMNCVNISRFFHGVYLFNADNNNITNSNANNNKIGFETSGSDNNILTNLIAIDNNYGLSLHISHSNTNTNLTSSNDRTGIRLYGGSQYNTINDSYIEDNAAYYGGVSIADEGTRYNTLYNNFFNNTVNILSDSDSNTNYWNTTKTLGTNIVGGPYIGGNFWTDPDGGNFSDTCTDSNADGICDSDYNLIRNEWDYEPLTSFSVQCSPTLNQNWIITDAQVCDAKEVTTGTGKIIVSTNGNLTLINSANVTCNGFEINRTGDSVFVLQNCRIITT